MVLILLRELLLVLLVVVLVYGIYKIARNAIRKEKVEEAVENIHTTLKTAKEIPAVKDAELKTAKEKIKETLKDGGV